MTEKSTKVNESHFDFLKPCPFCGSDDVALTQDIDDNSWGVVCHGYRCHAWTTNGKWICKRKEDAIELWNRRVYDPIEELRQNAPISLTYEQMKRYYYGHVLPFDINTEEKE